MRTFPGAGPYYVREYRPNQRIVIRRNRYYGGNREHHVDGFDVDLSADSPEEMLDRIEAGKADWGYTLPRASTRGRPRAHRQVRPQPLAVLDHAGADGAMFVFNSSRPLFKDNPELRRAVNLALDRHEFMHPRRRRRRPTNSCRRPWRDSRIARSTRSRGDLARAKTLAAGNLRGGKANLYVPDCAGRSGAQFVAGTAGGDRARGRAPAVRGMDTASAYLGRLGNPDEPWDMALVLWTPDFVDPFALHQPAARRPGRPAAPTSPGFDEAGYTELMRRAARLQGAARERAYAELDLALARDAAPILPITS